MAEEDGDIVDSWEDLEDNGTLDKKLKEMKPKKKQVESGGFTTPARPIDDSGRTQFTPQIKILKREPNANSTVDTNRPSVTKPAKTLEQREAEYAEARLRILGSDYAGGTTTANCTNNATTATTTTTTTSTTANHTHTDNHDPNRGDGAPRLVSKFEGMKVTENVVRQPRGPDGSKGFSTNANVGR